MNDIIFTALVC